MIWRLTVLTSGNEIGETATHASVFAQLITPDGVNHGLHNFLVPIRDPLSLKPYPGLSICKNTLHNGR